MTTSLGTYLGTPPLPINVYGGRTWDASNRLGSALGGSFRGKTTGHTIACLFKIDTQVDQGVLLDYLDTSGKGWGLAQYSATELRWRSANAAGNDWFYSAPYFPAADLGKVQLSVMTYGGGATSITHWAGDEKVGADVAVDGYTLPQTSVRLTVGVRSGGSAQHTGATVYGFAGWNRALSNAEIHYLYAYVAATGLLPTNSIGGEGNVYNIGSNVSGSSFPSTITDQVGGSNLTFYVGSSAAITLDTTSVESGTLPSPLVLAPSGIAQTRNWWSANDYNATTGDWTARAGSVATTLTQATSGKRPSKNATNAAFSNKPTVNADGTDDEFRLTSTFGMGLQPNTVGILGKWPGGAADYLIGQYASSSYQFYRLHGGTDQIYSDPNFVESGMLGAGIGAVHLWLFSKNGTAVTIYRDGVLYATRTMSSSSGTAGNFSLFSAGGSAYTAYEAGEVFTIDKAINADEAALLGAYFRNVEGYPI